MLVVTFVLVEAILGVMLDLVDILEIAILKDVLEVA